jgi:hypothetical protein
MPLAAHGTPVSIREMVRLRYSENPAEQGAGFWKSRRLVLVVMLKVPGMRAIGLFARGGLDRRRAVVVAARSLAVALAIVLLAGEAAWADCTPAAADNVTATCTGATTNQGGGLPGSTTGNDGYGTGVETGVTVNVVGGASNTVSGNTSGIFLGDATVTNNAGASITGGQFGILANSGAANVINSGSITGISGVGIRAQSDANVTNNAGASIAGVVGIVANAGGSSVFNAGNIIGDTVAIQFAGNGNTLTLAPTSQIFGLVLGTGSDIFQLGGTGAATFNVSSFSGPGGGYLGFGTFNKIDSSVWTLTGTNTAALPWSVNAGTLMVNGTIANSPMTVNTGGTLAGTGTVGNVTVETGGAFSPGSGAPGSTMAVSGNLAFQSGAFYLVQLNPAASSFASVTGTATLGGATVNASFAAGTFVAKQYAIVHATGGVTGTFGSQVNTNLPAGFKSSLSYDGNDAYLNLALSFIPPSSPNFGGGLNGNQARVGTALVNFFNSTSGIPMVFGSLSPAGLTQASGETVTGSQQTTFDAMNQFMGVMTDPFVAGRGEGGSVGGGATGYADGLALGYAQPRKPNDALAAITTKAPRFVPFTPGWTYGPRVLAVRKPPTAVQRPDRTTLPAASQARRSAPTTACRRIRSRALRSPAAASISASLAQAAAVPICSRPAPLCGTMWGRPISRRRSLTAGKTSPPTAPSASPGPTCCAPSSMPMPTRVASKAATVSSRHGWASRLTRPDSSPPSICRPMQSAHCRAPAPLRWPMVPRASPIRAANSACAATDPLRCRMPS